MNYGFNFNLYARQICILLLWKRGFGFKSISPWQTALLFISENDKIANFYNEHSTFAINEPRPHFAGKIENVTVNVGREAVLECPVNHLGRYKVGWLKAKDQTILALHHRVITHNNRFVVDHEDNRYHLLHKSQDLNSFE